MLNAIKEFFSAENFMPHGHCFLWQPGILWLHIISDAGIALAYYSIPVVLVYLTKKRDDLPFKNVFWLFGAFILLCGTTHLLGILVIWHPYYGIEGVVKAATAIVSIITCIVTLKLIPQALLLASPEKLERLNTDLRQSIVEKDEAQAKLKEAYDHMEQKVAERTHDLKQNNELLQSEIGERKITEKRLNKALDVLSSSNGELQRFAYVCSHDLQEPARVVANFAALMAKKYDGQLDDEAKKYIGFMQEGAERMQLMIKSVLSYSQIENQEGKHTEVDCNQILANVLHDLQASIINSGAQVHYSELPKLVGDPIHFAQLFQNLIGNALKFHKPGAVPEVTITADRGEGEWVFAVKDNGIGIKEQYLEKIFMIFQRLNRREDYAGTGIGLAICKKVVERYGGRIWVKSAEGVGTTFFFTVPDAVEE